MRQIKLFPEQDDNGKKKRETNNLKRYIVPLRELDVVYELTLLLTFVHDPRLPFCLLTTDI